MRVAYIYQEEEIHAFVQKAGAHFEANPEHATFTDGEIEPGCLFGVRWGLGDDCVLVLRLDDAFAPVIYGQVFRPRKEAPA